jgi:hypothetical protein
MPEQHISSIFTVEVYAKRKTVLYLLPNSRWFLAWIILRPWRWRLQVLPTQRLTSNELYDVISENTEKLKTKLRGLSPQANYTDRATAACRRS